jgi:ribonucleoside-diphosphate reductase alpha chain
MDYIFRWMAIKFLPRDAQPREDSSVQSLNGTEAEKATEIARQFTRASTELPPSGALNNPMHQGGLVGVNQSDDAPSCADCGAIMVRNGACYKCLNCGSTSGCS